LTAEEDQQLAQQAAELQAEGVVKDNKWPRKHAPLQCSNCNIQGHTRVSCPNR